jgi:hypothetical protein
MVFNRCAAWWLQIVSLLLFLALGASVLVGGLFWLWIILDLVVTLSLGNAYWKSTGR